MARNPNYTATVTYVDQSGEKATITVNTALQADISAGVPALVAALLTALRAELIEDQDPVQVVSSGALRLSSAILGEGNREDKVELRYVDNTTFKVYTSEVPCRKAGLATVPGSDIINPNDWTATKAAFEAVMRSPDGNAVTLQSVRLIGRRT